MEAHERRPKAGRISDRNFVSALDRRYALIRGRYETIEQECEVLTGVAALIEAQDRVESEKKLMKRVLDAIEIVARDLNPNWSPGRINPIYPAKRDALTGTMGRLGLNVLRKQRRPMSIREVSRAALEAHGRSDPNAREITRFENAIRMSFEKKVGSTLMVIPGPPKRYTLAP
jgi:hypothetical protein